MAALALDNRYELRDRYLRTEGRVFLTGIQALVRLLLDQKRYDAIRGLQTAGLVSGYRGSPLGGLDQELWRQKKVLSDADIRFEPGLNEDLAATMLWGAQQIEAFPGKRVEGVFSLWYGKGPGVDRTGDVFRNANILGTSAAGGVLAVAGDDHAAQSSMFPHQTDHVFEAAMMPILNPATVEEYLSFGLLGYALSRFSGCWVGFKGLSETVESGQSLTLSPLPTFRAPGDFEAPRHGLNYDPHLQWPAQRTELERRLLEERLPAAVAFARANGADKVLFDAPGSRIGIVTVGKAHTDASYALRMLGLSQELATSAGIAMMKIGLSWPIDAESVRRFAAGKQLLIVIEEKRSFVEAQIRSALYNLPSENRPFVIGKTNLDSRPLLPAVLELSPEIVARKLQDVFSDRGVAFRPLPPFVQEAGGADHEAIQLLTRKPTFCSGCPHNTSTKVPDGSFAAGGIGCHVMALGEKLKTRTFSQMGGEGVQWIGLSSFTDMDHIFANLGDGTYQHSGLLAIRQAVAAKARITYKILFNDAVAMTGGQPTEGGLTVDRIVRQVIAEGVDRVAVVTDDPDRYTRSDLLVLEPEAVTMVGGHLITLPKGVEVHHRDDLDTVQRAFREQSGVTVLIYDQTCAAEKRRRRKKGELSDPGKRVLINQRVCEGCGDCSVQSNCISIEPVETTYGRKREINQSACNIDMSCLKGFCPSFVTVTGAKPRKPDRSQFEVLQREMAQSLPEPSIRDLGDQGFNMVVTGIGGTGVVTIGSIIAMAAHLEGRAVRMLDFTGLAQKNGAVVSHVRVASTDEELDVVRVPERAADLVIACDLVVAASAAMRTRYEKARTVVVGNTTLSPTADFTDDRDLPLDAPLHRRVIERTTNATASRYVDAASLAARIFGDSIAANLFLVGLAHQDGKLPISKAALERAIELNGVAVSFNKSAYLWGRILAARPDVTARLEALAMGPRRESIASSDWSELVAHFARELTEYQDSAYAERYRRAVVDIAETEARCIPGKAVLAEIAARNLYKLMAVKDEYEVARLYTSGEFEEQLREAFDGSAGLTFHMAPPLLSKVDPATGRRRKLALNGRWLMPALRLLRHGKRLRGTPLDVFGHQHERRIERELVAQYEADLREALQLLTPDKHALIGEWLSWPDQVRGFGPVKEAGIAKAERFRSQVRERLAATAGAPPMPLAAE